MNAHALPPPAPAQAFACFSQALAERPRHVDTLVAAAALYKSCGLLPEAVHSLELALEERPADAPVSQALAVVLTDLGARGRGSPPKDAFVKQCYAASNC